HEVRATLSIGAAAVLAGETTHDALERPDAALYRAKLNGRDGVEVDSGIHRVHLTKASGYVRERVSFIRWPRGRLGDRHTPCCFSAYQRRRTRMGVRGPDPYHPQRARR